MKHFLSGLFTALILLTQTVGAQSVGSQAPDFKLVNDAGEIVTLANFTGTPLIINAWASWCAPCVEELPFFERIHTEVNAAEVEGLNMLLINNNEAPDRATAFLRDELDISLPVALDPTQDQLDAFGREGTRLDTTLRVLKNYRVRGMPTTFFIDADGVIQAVKVGFLLPSETPELLAKIGVEWQP